ncbi:MAG: prepilin peptidase [Lachnospiraceae bacterium]|nr:prepilin peptidase [Lachnospiraceae bacterium]
MLLGIQCVFAAMFGLVTGCYLNTLEYRIRSKKKINTKDCFCPNCQNSILLRDQIPVVGYVWLKGRCRSCGAPIGFHYPLIEAGVPLLYIASTLLAGSDMRKLFCFQWFGLALILLFRLWWEKALRPLRRLFGGLIILAVLQLPPVVGMWIIHLAG